MIFKFSEALSLAFHAVVLLSESGSKKMLVKDMAQKMGVSENHLSKVVQRLVKTGIFESSRGRNGGVSLAKKPEEILLFEIYEAIEGPIKLNFCLFKKPICSGGICIMGDFLKLTNKMFLEHLKNTKVSDLKGVFLNF